MCTAHTVLSASHRVNPGVCAKRVKLPRSQYIIPSNQIMRQHIWISDVESGSLLTLKRPTSALFPSAHGRSARAAPAHGERSAVGVLAPLASFLPAGTQPGGCFLSALSFNLCYFVEDTHLNGRAQYHALTRTRQRTIRRSPRQHAHKPSSTLLLLDIWCDESPSGPPWGLWLSCLLSLFVFSPASFYPSVPFPSPQFPPVMRPSFTFGLVQMTESSSCACALQIACNIHKTRHVVSCVDTVYVVYMTVGYKGNAIQGCNILLFLHN